MKVLMDENGRPTKRCRLHGSAPGSGSAGGNRPAAEALSRKMKTFWSDWKAAGKPPIVRGAVDTRKKTNAQVATPTPANPKPKPVVLSEEDKAFARMVGMKLPGES
jgi:hypothetical protein